MFRSRIVSLAIAAAALMSASSIAVDRWRSEAVASVLRRAHELVDWLVRVVIEPLRTVLREARAWAALRVAALLVSAKAFASRIERRERPVVFARWRMCPSA